MERETTKMNTLVTRQAMQVLSVRLCWYTGKRSLDSLGRVVHVPGVIHSTSETFRCMKAAGGRQTARESKSEKRKQKVCGANKASDVWHFRARIFRKVQARHLCW